MPFSRVSWQAEIDMSSVALSSAAIPLRLPSPGPRLEKNQETELCDMHVHELREAIRSSRISFPSQVPVFPKHDRPDLQQKLVQLYFVRGWSCPKIGARYGLSRGRVLQILNTWKRRAVEVGSLQRIPPEESYAWLLKHPPVQVVFQQMVADTEPPALQPIQVAMPPIASTPEADTFPLTIATPVAVRPSARRVLSRRSHRPRRKFDMAQIVAVLRELGAGRSVAQMAAQTGASESSIRIWKEQYGPLVNEPKETRPASGDNLQLQGLLARIGAVEETLTSLISSRRGDRLESFLPLPATPLPLESHHRESR